jgi:hypothetical protein
MSAHPPIEDWKLQAEDLELTQDKQQESQCAFPIQASHITGQERFALLVAERHGRHSGFRIFEDELSEALIVEDASAKGVDQIDIHEPALSRLQAANALPSSG